MGIQKMRKLTVRLDEELSKLISDIKSKNLYNLSAFVRQVLKEKLSKLIDIDNSGQLRGLEKDNVI